MTRLRRKRLFPPRHQRRLCSRGLRAPFRQLLRRSDYQLLGRSRSADHGATTPSPNACRPTILEPGERMRLIGHVESVWRYPVKSMAGEELPEIYAGFAGIWGDRLFAFKSSATPAGFPYLTGREAHQLLMYRPRFRDPQRAAKPANLAEAEEISPLLNPVAADPSDFALDIETPSGELLPIDDQTLLQQLNRLVGD